MRKCQHEKSKITAKTVRARHVLYFHNYFGGNNMNIHSVAPRTATVTKQILLRTRGASRISRVAHQRSEPSHAPHTLKGARPLRCRGRVLFGASEFPSYLYKRKLQGPQSWPLTRARSVKEFKVRRLATHKYQFCTLPSSCFFGCLQAQRCASKSKPSSSSSLSS